LYSRGGAHIAGVPSFDQNLAINVCLSVRLVAQIKFPAIREINREFCNFGPSATILNAYSAGQINGLEKNSLSTDQI
jgi:hypothetical protein